MAKGYKELCPCKRCDDRFVGCHTSCKKYNKWKASGMEEAGLKDMYHPQAVRVGEFVKGNVNDVCAELEKQEERCKDMSVWYWLKLRKLERAVDAQFDKEN